MTEFTAVTTNVPINCQLGATLVLRHGVVVAVMGSPSAMAEAIPLVELARRRLAINARDPASSQQRVLPSDACDGQIMAWLNGHSGLATSRSICDGIGVDQTDKPMRSHIGQRLRDMARAGLIFGKTYGPAGRYWAFGLERKDAA